jgi:hypothetical protein
MQVVAVVEHKHQLDQDQQVAQVVVEQVDGEQRQQEHLTLAVVVEEQAVVVDH